MGNELGIKIRVLFLTLVPSILISLFLSAYFTSTRLQDLETGLKDRGYAIALQLAPASEYGVFSGNKETLQHLVNDAHHDEVVSVNIFNKNGHLLAHAGRQIDLPPSHHHQQHNDIIMTDQGDSLLFTVPVKIKELYLEDFPDSQYYPLPEQEELILGWITLEMGRDITTLRQYQVLFTCSMIVLIGIGISGVFAFRMGRDVTRPILEMSYAVEKIKDGNLDTRIYTNARGELRLLEEGINTMAKALKTAHEEMQQSVEQATADLRQTLETIEIQNIELEMARKEAETASRVKSEFLANMSHEIRTPLNGVIGFINLLIKTELSARQSDYLHTIKKSATSLLSIINDILDFSKMEAGKLRLDALPMDLRECIEDATTLLAPAAHEKALELVPLIYSDVPTKIIGDHLRLKQIITNLVSNSIKFTEQGSIIIRVMLEKNNNNQVMLCISVTDSGVGLTPEQQKTLFQAFKQADSTTTRKYGGTGLGLIISKRLVQQMGGEIGVESEAGKGSTFWFSFLADKIPISNAADNLASSSFLKNKRFLIYEQHYTARLAIHHLLTLWGADVQELMDASQLDITLQQAAENQKAIDMVFIGINQPELNSHFIEDLVALIRHKHGLPVGVLANTTDQTLIDAILATGTDICLAKPVRLKKLHEEISRILIPHPEHKINTTENIILTNLSANEKSIHILAVDDYPANLKLVKALLEDTGVVILGAHSGIEALKHVKNHDFDLILMDIQMPGMDGVEVTHRIRTLEKGTQKHTPIIALTAHALLSEREALLQAGIDDYLTKPINELELIQIIKKWGNKKTEVNHLAASKLTSTPTTPTLHTHDSPIDWMLALKLAGNKSHLAKELLASLKLSLPGDQQNINYAFEEQDFLQLREHVHKLHGACCYCGVPKLKQAANALETTVATALKTGAKLNIDMLLLNLNQEIDAVIKYKLEYETV